ncbi:MAG: ABC transporter permease, partial [Planctomycetota bacterium]
FQTGHMKITSSAYAQEADQMPNDLALMGIDTILANTSEEYPDIIWAPRIRFGGLLDIPDEAGETRSQGPVFGLAMELLSKDSPEPEILNLQQALVRGRLPKEPGEILISDEFAQNLEIELGQTATLMGSTMYGSVAMHNFEVAGTIRFGIGPMDRGAIIADIGDIQQVLDMQNSAAEILGFFPDFQYRQQSAEAIKAAFNARYQDPGEEFSPLMLTLRDQNELGGMLDLFAAATGIIIGIFLFVMFIVLWNAGLMGSLRRYGEIGVRLAIGELKGHIYRSMLFESFMVSLVGSVIGTALGLTVGYWLQNTGIDLSSMFKSSSMLVSNVMRAQVTSASYVIGFIPGILATMLGTAVAGIGIYKRQTSQLFKELEV